MGILPSFSATGPAVASGVVIAVEKTTAPLSSERNLRDDEPFAVPVSFKRFSDTVNPQLVLKQ